jgi:hypothetical protein
MQRNASLEPEQHSITEQTVPSALSNRFFEVMPEACSALWAFGLD